MRARYSPMMPMAKSCAPANMAMIDARNENPGPVIDRNVGKPGRAPRQQHIYGDRRTAVIRKRSPQRRTECTERTDIARSFCAHRALQRKLGDSRRDISPKTVLLL